MKLRKVTIDESNKISPSKRERGSSRSAPADSLLGCVPGVRGSERIRSLPPPRYAEYKESEITLVSSSITTKTTHASVPSNKASIAKHNNKSSSARNIIDSDEDDDDENEEDESQTLGKRPKRSNTQENGNVHSNVHVEEKKYTTLSGRVVKSRTAVEESTVHKQTTSGNQPKNTKANNRKDSHIDDGDDDDGSDDSENDDSDDESEDDQQVTKKYSFRDREATRRETINVQTLGGDGGGYRRSTVTTSHRLREVPNSYHEPPKSPKSPKVSRNSFSNPQPRLYLGGKIPNPSHYTNKHSSKHKHSSGGHNSIRRHFDSSSDSSSSDDDIDRHKSSRNRHAPGGVFSDDDDLQFTHYEKQRLQQERDSIVPINFSDNKNTNSDNFTGSRNSNGYGNSSTGGSLGGSLRDKASRRDLLRADADPVAVDSAISFNSIGGLEKHIHALKEMVLLPLLYPEVFSRFGTEPPRGVLFLGPPGTGKTLTARALANSVSMGEQFGGRKISFFMRKGADCLSKWVGEGERQLRLLFEQAKKFQPSIIFFDEIDGLAPVRSVKQDQIHASIVSTLLALMDGLDARGQVVVIGATNRPDAIDPALRRPGRFDRELTFPLPSATGRSAILSIHTAKWNPPLSPETHDWIVKSTAGYCGADIKALCAEAALVSLRRSYPQVYESNTRLTLDPSQLVVRRGDFAAALNKIVPCSQRTGILMARQLDPILKPLLDSTVSHAMQKLGAIFPPAVAAATATSSASEQAASGVLSGNEPNGHIATSSSAASTQLHSSGTKQFVSSCISINQDSEEWVASLTDADVTFFTADTTAAADWQFNYNLGRKGAKSNGQSNANMLTTGNTGLDNKESWLWSSRNLSYRPRFLLIGAHGMGQDEVAAAMLHQLESIPSFSLDIPSLVSDLNAHSAEQALICRVQEACRVSPAVVYLPNILHWWAAASEPLRTALYSLTELPTSHLPVLWLSTLMVSEQDVSDLQHAFDLADPTHNSGTSRSSSPRGAGVELSSSDVDIRSFMDIRLLTLLKWLSGREDFNQTSVQVSEMIEKETPATCMLYAAPAAQRTSFFQSYFATLYQLPAKIYSANISILKSRTQKLEVAAEPAPEALNTSNGRKTRSSSRVKSSTDSPESYKADLNDADKQCKREIRTFFRAALSELMREKRCHVFNRPVDPEIVTDYYDIVKCPMDLETMRMKVDDDLYPTLAHFLRDITQIVYNAKIYNPLTRADQRGRSIVHAGHGMLDMVESHAYHFKEELGYDLFRKCEGIALREGCEPPRGKPQPKDQMPEEDERYYSMILQEHERLRREEGREVASEDESDNNKHQQKSNRHTRSSALDEDNLKNSDSDSDSDDDEENRYIYDKRNSQKHASAADSRRTSTSSQSLSHGKSQSSRRQSRGSGGSIESLADKDFFACMDAVLSRRKPSSKSKATTNQDDKTIDSSINLNNEKEAEFDENDDMNGQSGSTQMHEEAQVTETIDLTETTTTTTAAAAAVSSSSIVTLSELTEADIEQLPIIVNLRASILAAQSACRGGLVERLASAIVECTEDWSVSQLMALMTKVNVIWRNFQIHGCWDISFDETESLVKELKKSAR